MIFFRKNSIDLFFKSDGSERAFFPYGRFGRGRVVDAEQEASVRSRLAKWYLFAEIVLVAQILLQPFIGMERLAYLVALEIVLLLVVYRLMFRLLLRDYPISRTTISTREIRLKQARTMSAVRLIFLVIAGVLMTAASGFSFRLSLRSPDWHTAISGFGVLFFGASLIVIIRMIFMRNSSVPTP